jgi:DNA-binding ferritin-like protein (Dps family)
MFMDPKELIELNNEKRELLTEENKEIYGNMLTYIRMANIAEHHTEEVLMDVLDHLLDAQERGKTAHDVFGKDPKAYCDELIDALPKYTFWQGIRAYMFVPYLLLCISFSIEAIGVIIARIFDHPREEMQTFFINPLGIMSLFICSFLLLFLAQNYLRNFAFKEEKKTFRSFFVPWLVLTLLSIGAIGGNILFRKLGWLMLPVPLWLGIVLSILWYVLYKVSFNRREA